MYVWLYILYCEKLLSLLRLRAIQISISHDQLNNRNSNNDDDLLATTNHVAATGPNSVIY